MNTIIDVVCYRTKTLSSGESPLMLRLTKEGKRKYVSLQISLKPDYWDFNKNKPRRNCPEKDSINFSYLYCGMNAKCAYEITLCKQFKMQLHVGVQNATRAIFTVPRCPGA